MVKSPSAEISSLVSVVVNITTLVVSILSFFVTTVSTLFTIYSSTKKKPRDLKLTVTWLVMVKKDITPVILSHLLRVVVESERKVVDDIVDRYLFSPPPENLILKNYGDASRIF